jgi:hypothetical protein
MIKNLYNDTHYKRELEGSPVENDSEWMAIASLIAVILFLGYFILG